MRFRGSVAVLLCLAALTVATSRAGAAGGSVAASRAGPVAQAPSPPETGPPCAEGQLCGNGGSDFKFTTTPAGRVNDPPGAVTRSLTAIGLIALVLGTYLYIALTGKPVPLLALLGRRGRGAA
jgi:hypothetical protein